MENIREDFMDWMEAYADKVKFYTPDGEVSHESAMIHCDNVEVKGIQIIDDFEKKISDLRAELAERDRQDAEYLDWLYFWFEEHIEDGGCPTKLNEREYSFYDAYMQFKQIRGMK